MKIKYKNEPTIVKFDSLKAGDVCRPIHDETIFMKVHPDFDNEHYNPCTAISLANGEPAFFGDTDEVVLLSATLVIE